MGDSLLIFEAMKVTLVLFACLALAFGQECPENPPCKDNEMACPTGHDEETGCMFPDMCMPVDPEGPCAVTCPCQANEMTCDMGIDEASDCMMPPTCVPLKGGPMDINGVECPVFCGCKPNEMWCDQGVDELGCQRQPVCMPMKGGPIGKDGSDCPVHCPCKMDEMPCPTTTNGLDENDCAAPDMCMPAGDMCPKF